MEEQIRELQHQMKILQREIMEQKTKELQKQMKHVRRVLLGTQRLQIRNIISCPYTTKVPTPKPTIHAVSYIPQPKTNRQCLKAFENPCSDKEPKTDDTFNNDSELDQNYEEHEQIFDYEEEEEIEPDEDECLFVRRALSGTTDQEEIFQRETYSCTIFETKLHGSEINEELFPAGLNKTKELGSSNLHVIVYCEAESVVQGLYYKGEYVVGLGQIKAFIYNKSSYTWFKWDSRSHTIQYAFGSIHASGYPPKIPPEPPPMRDARFGADAIFSSLRTLFQRARE